MSKKRPPSWKFRAVMVYAETKGREIHDFAANPYVGWAWTAEPEHPGAGGFKRLEDAQADAARVLGHPVTWEPRRGRRTFCGTYGPPDYRPA